MAFSPYECVRGQISPPKNVHMSHIEMTKHTGILSGILYHLQVQHSTDAIPLKQLHQGYKIQQGHKSTKVNANH